MRWVSLIALAGWSAITAQTINFSAIGISTPTNYLSDLGGFGGSLFAGEGVAVGDFNGDGKADLAIAAGTQVLADGTNTAVIAILLSNGDGTFQRGRVYSLKAAVPATIVVGDFNGDGRQDLALPNSQFAAVLLGNGDGSFRPEMRVALPGFFPTSLALGDFNRDGKLDMAIAENGFNGNQIAVLLGKGDGTFQPPVTYTPATNAGARWIVAADFNGDGTPDLMSGGLTIGGGSSVSLMLGNGNGTFRTAVGLLPDTYETFNGAAADFNGDGKLDVAIAIFTNVVVILGNGDGTFQPAQPLVFPAYAPGLTQGSLLLADFDGDGKVDLMTTGGPGLQALRGNGDGTFQPPNYFNVGYTPQMAWGDFNGDGKPDLAAPLPVSAGTLYLSILLNTSGLPMTRTISHIADGEGWRTTIMLLNTSTVGAAFALHFRSDAGSPMVLDLGPNGSTAVFSGVIPAHGARFIRTAGTAAVLAKGWAELVAPDNVDGNSIFGLQTPGQGDSEAAVPLIPAGGQDLFLPFDNTQGHVTGVAFADPGPHGATVSGSFLDDSGVPVADMHTVAVPAGGHSSQVLTDFFPATRAKRGVAHFSADTNVFGLGIRANGKAFTTIEALPGLSRAGVIAHIASGGGWKTTFLLVNTDALAGEVTLNFWDDNGGPLTLPLGADGAAASVPATIAPGGLRIFQTTGAGPLATGWASVSTPGHGGVFGGTAIFASHLPGGAGDSEAAVPFSSFGSTQLFMPFDYTPGYSTGIAITNANPQSAATVTLSFFDEAGMSLTDGKVVMVPARGHISRVLADLFPGVAGARGTVSLTSDLPIAAVGIRANGVAFTTLKVIAK